MVQPEFVNQIVGTAIPPNFIPACDKVRRSGVCGPCPDMATDATVVAAGRATARGGAQGFAESVAKGPLTQNPVTSVRMALTDGLAHSVDSNELSFRQATKSAFRQGAAVR